MVPPAGLSASQSPRVSLGSPGLARPGPALAPVGGKADSRSPHGPLNQIWYFMISQEIHGHLRVCAGGFSLRGWSTFR